MDDAEIIASARAEIAKVRNWRDGRKKPDDVEYVLPELHVAERLLALAEAHVAKGSGREP